MNSDAASPLPTSAKPTLASILDRCVAALTGPAWGKGLPPAPPPTDEDRAEATRRIDAHLAGKSPSYIRVNRDSLIHSAAFSVRDERRRREASEGAHDALWLEAAE